MFCTTKKKWLGKNEISIDNVLYKVELTLYGYFDLGILFYPTLNVMHMIKFKCYIDDSMFERFELRNFIQRISHTT